MRFDAIVVGGSFAGQSAAMQLARARRSVLIIDGGMPRNRFAKAAHGFLGQDGKAPHAIMQEAMRQLAAYPDVEVIQGDVINASKTLDGFAVTLATGQALCAGRLVLATGVIDELPSLPGLQERWGVSVLHCPYCHGYEVADLELGVLGSHPMSAHQAGLMPDWGPTTYFTQGVYEPDADQTAHLTARGVRVVHSPVVELLGAAPALDGVRLADGQVIEIRALFVAPRTHLASPLAAQLGCAVDEGPLGPFLRVDDWKQTTVAGVYAAGDAAMPMHNATLASASGVMAGVGAHQSLAKEIAAPAITGLAPIPGAADRHYASSDVR